jgi:amino-acid N-acetyltransferase
VTMQAKSRQCVSLRAAEPADLPAILALLERAQLPAAGVAESLSDFIIAVSDGHVVGVAGLEIYHHSALLRSVAVEPDWRNTGVGRVLIERALSSTRERGITDVFLLTTTAEHYFPRFGFTCVSRDTVTSEVQASAEFQGACPATAVVMHKALSSDDSEVTGS